MFYLLKHLQNLTIMEKKKLKYSHFPQCCNMHRWHGTVNTYPRGKLSNFSIVIKQEKKNKKRIFRIIKDFIVQSVANRRYVFMKDFCPWALQADVTLFCYVVTKDEAVRLYLRGMRPWESMQREKNEYIKDEEWKLRGGETEIWDRMKRI